MSEEKKPFAVTVLFKSGTQFTTWYTEFELEHRDGRLVRLDAMVAQNYPGLIWASLHEFEGFVQYPDGHPPEFMGVTR